jgi:hypothetical protein
MHVRMYVGMCGRVVHTGIDMCVYSDRCHAHRWVHVHLSPSVRLYLYMCMDIRLYLDTCTLERRRGARVGVRLWRVRPRGLHLPQGTVAAPNASVCPSRARGCVCVHAWSPLHGFGPFGPTSAHWCAAGAGRTRARCAAGPSPQRR